MRRGPSRSGFTLVEMLVALAATLIMMATVVAIFASVSDSIRDSRATIEMTDRLRGVQNRLQTDLSGITVTPIPTRRPGDGEGYFEIIEGPMGPVILLGALDSPGVSELEAALLVAPTNEDPDGDGTQDPDTTVGDLDDILMFTTRNLREPFIGRFNGDTVESRVAEVVWFVRGTTLYRRVLLVLPGIQSSFPASAHDVGFYANYDISVREEGSPSYDRNPSPGGHRLVANTLGDLTKRENRYGHQPYGFPHDARFWGRLGMPTLRESSSVDWPFPWTVGAMTDPAPSYNDLKSQLIIPAGPGVAAEGFGINQLTYLELTPQGEFDAWSNRHPWVDHVDPVTGTLIEYNDRFRVAEDIVLTNVLSFDVKVWDPGAPVFVDATSGIGLLPGDTGFVNACDRFAANPSGPVQPRSFGAYVDLNYMCRLGPAGGLPDYTAPAGAPAPLFHGPGDFRSHLQGTVPNQNPMPNQLIPSVYDTWSFHYERDGFDHDGILGADQGTNGFDDNNSGGVDDATELEAPPPYPYALRGIQVKIRTFDPDSRQIREVTVGHEFLPE